MTTKTLAKILINTLLGVVLIIIWLNFVNLNQILSSLSRVQLVNLIPVFISLFLSQAIRAFRLKILLSKITSLSLKELVFLNGLAMMLNFFIPIRAGEITKGLYLNSNHGLPVKKSLIWILLDRFIDFLSVLILASLLLLVIPTALSITIIIFIIIILITLLILTYLMIYRADFSRKIFKFLSILLIVPIIKIYFERILDFFLDSFVILRRKPGELFLIFAVTILAYGVDAATIYFSFLALGSVQNYLTLYLAQLLSALTYLIPAAPGYVGSAEASGLLIFSGIFGIKADLSSAMIVLLHISTIIFALIFGILSLYFLKINLGEILRKIFRRN